MNNTTVLINKFKDGERLSNEELTLLRDEMYGVYQATIGKGEYFKQTYLFAVDIYHKAEDTLNCRGVYL